MSVYITPPVWDIDTGRCVKAGTKLTSVLFYEKKKFSSVFTDSECINPNEFIEEQMLFFLILKLYRTLKVT